MPPSFRLPLMNVLVVLALVMVLTVWPRPASCAVEVPFRVTVDVTMSSSDNLPGQPGDFESFYVSGDKPVTRTGAVGATSTAMFNKGQIGAVWCNYRFGANPDQQANLQIDVYQHTPGGPLLLLMICPHCTARGHVGKDQDHGIQIRQESKAIEFEAPTPQQRMIVFPGWAPAAMLRDFPNGLGGILSVAPFGCTWDVLPQHREIVGGRVCDFHAVIERNVIRRVARGR